MQLNKTMKVKIIAGLAKQNLKAEAEELSTEVTNFITKLFNDRHGKLDASLKAKLTKKEIQESFSKGFSISVELASDQKYCSTSLKMPGVLMHGVGGDMVRVAGIGGKAFVSMNDAIRTNTIQSMGRGITIEKNEREYEATKALIKKVDSFDKKGKDLCDNLEAVIMPQKTDTRLLELLPEAAPFIPKKAQAYDIVPIETVENVRKMLSKEAA